MQSGEKKLYFFYKFIKKEYKKFAFPQCVCTYCFPPPNMITFTERLADGDWFYLNDFYWFKVIDRV